MTADEEQGDVWRMRVPGIEYCFLFLSYLLLLLRLLY